MHQIRNYDQLAQYMFDNRVAIAVSGNISFDTHNLKIAGVVVWNTHDKYSIDGPWKADEFLVVTKLALDAAQQAHSNDIEALQKRLALAQLVKQERDQNSARVWAEYKP